MLSLTSLNFAGLNKKSDTCRYSSCNSVGCSTPDMIPTMFFLLFEGAVLLLPLSQANPDCRGKPCRQLAGHRLREQGDIADLLENER